MLNEVYLCSIYITDFCSDLCIVCLLLQKEYLEREMEKRIVRTNPLGKDRNCNRYWFFRREGKVFVESTDSMQWGYYETKEEVIICSRSVSIFSSFDLYYFDINFPFLLNIA